jgi:hypothetical protein
MQAVDFLMAEGIEADNPESRRLGATEETMRP